MILQSLSNTMNIPIEKCRNICKAYPTRSNRKYLAGDEDNLPDPVPETDRNPRTNSDSQVSNDTAAVPDGADEIVCEPCSDPLIDDYYRQYDASFTGMKESLDRRHKRMDNLQLHMSMGCIGHHRYMSKGSNPIQVHRVPAGSLVLTSKLLVMVFTCIFRHMYVP